MQEEKTKEEMFIDITRWCNSIERNALDNLRSGDADEDIKQRFEQFEAGFRKLSEELFHPNECPPGYHNENGFCVPD